MADLLIRNVEVDGRVVDVATRGDAVVEVGPKLAPTGEHDVVDGDGGALLPGLHDHHVHLLATAAARASVDVGPPRVRTRDDFADALRRADRASPRSAWIRAVGYHESVAGDLDRHVLDAIVGSRPVRVQHRSGARWTLNTAGLVAVGTLVGCPGVDLDDRGDPTGRLHRADHWLGHRIAPDQAVDLRATAAELAAYGITGVTDATPYTTVDALAPLVDAALQLDIVVTGGVELAGTAAPPPLRFGPVKIVLDEGVDLGLDDLVDRIHVAHRHHRPVAVHCVTAASVALLIAALDVVGPAPGDRVEHGSVIVPQAIGELRRLGVTVVTQPGFIAERGDEYLADVEPNDLPHLYRLRSLIDAGIPVGLSTDSPYTSADPWLAIAAAAERRSRAGHVLGPDDAIDASAALDRFLTPSNDPGGRPRRIAPGAPASFCLLDRPLRDALRAPSSRFVRWSRTGCSGDDAGGRGVGRAVG